MLLLCLFTDMQKHPKKYNKVMKKARIKTRIGAPSLCKGYYCSDTDQWPTWFLLYRPSDSSAPRVQATFARRHCAKTTASSLRAFGQPVPRSSAIIKRRVGVPAIPR